MFDTHIVLVGNVLTAPEWRRTNQAKALVVNFRVASTSRRWDRENGRWVDGASLRVRVNCWRRLAEGVASSVTVGDPVVVVGRLYTRDWTDADNNPRTSYEMEAVAVGHDLARGKARFFRNRPAPATSAVDGPEADTMVRGEAAEPVEAPIGYGEGLPDADEPVFLEFPDGADPVAALADLELGLAGAPDADGPGGDAFAATGGDGPGDDGPGDDGLGGDATGSGDGEPAGADAPVEGSSSRSRRGGRRQPVPA